MSAIGLDNIPEDATGLRLCRINKKGELLLCERVQFVRGRDAVHTALRRAALSGRVEVDGKIENHFADILDREGSFSLTVALDAKSYSSLKNKWMRCKLETYS